MNSALAILMQPSAFSTGAVSPCKIVLQGRHRAAFIDIKDVVKIKVPPTHSEKTSHIDCSRSNHFGRGEPKVLFEMPVVQPLSHTGGGIFFSL